MNEDYITLANQWLDYTHYILFRTSNYDMHQLATGVHSEYNI